MNFDLHLYGETPAELLEVLSHLGHMDGNYHTPIPDVRHPAQAPATLDKIRDLARSLIVHGKRAEVQQIIKGTGAASISKLPSDSYADVWEQLVNLSKEVDNNAAG